MVDLGRTGLSLAGLMPEASENPEIKRLRWRCRRGMRELDQLMLRYLDHAWPIDDDNTRKQFLQLLDCEDDKLWRWFMGRERPEDEQLAQLVTRIAGLPL